MGDAVSEFLRLEGRMPGEGSFEFSVSERDDAGDRADIEYLFHQAAGVTHCYTSSHWTQRVKVIGRATPLPTTAPRF